MQRRVVEIRLPLEVDSERSKNNFIGPGREVALSSLLPRMMVAAVMASDLSSIALMTMENKCGQFANG